MQECFKDPEKIIIYNSKEIIVIDNNLSTYTLSVLLMQECLQSKESLAKTFSSIGTDPLHI